MLSLIFIRGIRSFTNLTVNDRPNRQDSEPMAGHVNDYLTGDSY